MKTNGRPRRISRWALGFLALGLVAAACTADQEALPEDSEIFSPDGATHSLAEFQGTPVVLNFFASWCPPCRAEMPDFQTVSQERGGEVRFVGVSRDFDNDAWFGLLESTGVTFPTFAQPSEELFLASGGLAMPTTVFLDADGNVERVHSGPLSRDRLGDFIDEFLLAES